MDDREELSRQVERLSTRNSQLVGLLKDSRDRLQQLSAQLDDLADPASGYGVFLGYSDPTRFRDAEVFTNGRRMRVKISPHIEPGALHIGQLVRLGEGLIVVEACGFASNGTLGTIAELVDDQRAVITTSSGEELIVVLAEDLHDQAKPGDSVVFDARAGVATEVIDRVEVSQLHLEEIPDTTFDDIGGLESQISQIRDAVELPFIHPEMYERFGLQPPKGVLLYGPPGCGKTLIAKAVANSLAQHLGGQSSFFINVKGPELLNKFVGETERRIRLIFERARELAQSSTQRPVIIFFDEMESIFRTRGSGVSSDMETTVVPQLLTELDGVENLKNVIVIGATNREELIDPAIMRPGRLDIKIRIRRPDPNAAKDIFAQHLHTEIPVDGDPQVLIQEAVDKLFSDRVLAKVIFSNGSNATIFHRDLISGAMIANIIARAKKLAIKDAITHPAGQTIATAELSSQHLATAIEQEWDDNDYIPAQTSLQEWAQLTDKAGGRTISRVELISNRGGMD